MSEKQNLNDAVSATERDGQPRQVQGVRIVPASGEWFVNADGAHRVIESDWHDSEDGITTYTIWVKEEES